MKKQFTLVQLLEMHTALDNLRFSQQISDATSTSLSKNMKAFKAKIDEHQPLVQAVYDRYQEIIAAEQPDISEDQRVMTGKQVTAMQKEANAVALEMLDVDVIMLKRGDFPKDPKLFGIRKKTVSNQDGTKTTTEVSYYENYVILRDEIILGDEEFKKLNGQATKTASKQPTEVPVS